MMEQNNSTLPKSRSQKKRESTALQELGRALTSLSSACIKQLPLPPELAEAMHQWHTLKSHEAKRRQMQYIGKLMRSVEEPGSLARAVSSIEQQKQLDTHLLHKIEEMRDTLIEPDAEQRSKAVDEAVDSLPGLDRGQLSQLAAAATAEQEKKKSPKMKRALFQLLRQAVKLNEKEEQSQSGQAPGSSSK